MAWPSSPVLVVAEIPAVDVSLGHLRLILAQKCEAFAHSLPCAWTQIRSNFFQIQEIITKLIHDKSNQRDLPGQRSSYHTVVG